MNVAAQNVFIETVVQRNGLRSCNLRMMASVSVRNISQVFSLERDRRTWR